MTHNLCVTNNDIIKNVVRFRDHWNFFVQNLINFRVQVQSGRYVVDSGWPFVYQKMDGHASNWPVTFENYKSSPFYNHSVSIGTVHYFATVHFHNLWIIRKLTKKPFDKHHRRWNKPNNKIPSVEKSDQVFGFFGIWIILPVVIFFVHWRVQSFIFIFIERKYRIYKPWKKLIFEL